MVNLDKCFFPNTGSAVRRERNKRIHKCLNLFEDLFTLCLFISVRMYPGLLFGLSRVDFMSERQDVR